MRLDLSLSQRPELQLRLSPQLIQRIEILQLPATELMELVAQECAENETLEMEAPRDDRLATAKEAAAVADAPSDVDEEVANRLEQYTSYNEALRPKIRRDDVDPKLEAMANTPAKTGSLHEHLVAQLGFSSLPPRVRAFAEILIDHLDENGFLSEPLEELLIPHDGQFSREDAEQALAVLKSLDPPGVGARDMRECFLMQLDPDHPRFALHRKLIADHLEDWGENRLPKIVRETGADLDEVKAAMDELKGILSPPPGRLFHHEPNAPVRPDVVVSRVDDRYEVRLEDDYYPTVSVSSGYLDLYRSGSLDARTRRDLKGKIERARFLIEAIEQRKNTLHKVANEIVERQREFLETGRLLPLKMRDVADELGLHVSTVSRAISEKWMQTPRGIFPMKYFFTGAAPGGEGAGLESRDSVRHKVQEIIDAEDKQNPLSDEDVVAKLRELGLDIARRTVTKYRKMLKIPSSRQRREY